MIINGEVRIIGGVTLSLHGHEGEYGPCGHGAVVLIIMIEVTTGVWFPPKGEAGGHVNEVAREIPGELRGKHTI